MSWALIGAAIAAGVGTVISNETTAWKRAAKRARQMTHARELAGYEDPDVSVISQRFSKDGWLTTLGEHIGSVPVAGPFAKKAFYDEVSEGDLNPLGTGASRQTGTWKDAGIELGIDTGINLLKAVPVLGPTVGTAAGTAVDTALPTVLDTVLDTAVETALPTVLDTAVDTALPTVLDTAVEVSGTAIPDALGAVTDVAPEVAPGLWEMGQEAIRDSRDFLKEPLVDAFGKKGGEYAFKTIGDVPVGAAIGAARDPDNPGRGAATGAAGGAFDNVLDLGFDGLDSFMPDETPKVFGPEDLGRTAIDAAIGGAAKPIVGMGVGAVYDALTPDPYDPQDQDWLKNPYGQAYGAGNMFSEPYGTRRRV